jgi:hypothetical protein
MSATFSLRAELRNDFGLDGDCSEVWLCAEVRRRTECISWLSAALICRVDRSSPELSRINGNSPELSRRSGASSGLSAIPSRCDECRFCEGRARSGVPSALRGCPSPEPSLGGCPGTPPDPRSTEEARSHCSREGCCGRTIGRGDSRLSLTGDCSPGASNSGERSELPLRGTRACCCARGLRAPDLSCAGIPRACVPPTYKHCISGHGCSVQRGSARRGAAVARRLHSKNSIPKPRPISGDAKSPLNLLFTIGSRPRQVRPGSRMHPPQQPTNCLTVNV